MAAPVRRTQAERSAATTARILEAAAACLVERGWAGTSTTVVCRRAGVSRGALLHHFPTKADLVTAAVHHIMDRCFQEFGTRLATLPADTPRLARVEAAIDIVWGIFRGDTITAWQELALAARTDPHLAPIVVAARAELDRRVLGSWHDLFPPDDTLPLAFYEVAPVYLFALLEGLALRRRVAAPASGTDTARADREVDTESDLVLLATKLVVRTLADADPGTVTRHLDDLLTGVPSPGVTATGGPASTP